MGYNELEIELRKMLARVERWRETGFTPAIEQGIALSRLQKIYTELTDVPTEDWAQEDEKVEQAVTKEADQAEKREEEEGRKDEEQDDAQDRQEEVEKEATDEPQKREKVGKVEILGIPVSGYAKQEIVNNLFHGNIPLFEEEQKKFDAMDSLEEALVYIGETYHWIPEHAATIKFIDLLETKFKE